MNIQFYQLLHKNMVVNTVEPFAKVSKKETSTSISAIEGLINWVEAKILARPWWCGPCEQTGGGQFFVSAVIEVSYRS
jgi:hypothetical protein